MTRNRLSARYWLPVVIWMALIFSGSGDLLSANKTSRFIGPFLRWLLPGISEASLSRVHGVVRKAGHVFEYAVLSGLIWRALARPGQHRNPAWRWQHASLAFLGAALYAGSDELHEALVASRTGTIVDVAYDSFGALLGLACIWLWVHLRKRPTASEAATKPAFPKPLQHQ